MKGLEQLVWLTQLGLSVAAPLALSVLSALWLRERFQLGGWVLILGIALGFYLAIGGFRTSLKTMERMCKDWRDEHPPPVSYDEHD